MWPFNFPYTNFHELNLDWILKEIQTIPQKVNQAVASLEINTGNVFNAVSEGFDNTGASDNLNIWKEKIANAGIYFFPSGTYLFSSEISLPSGVTLVGIGECEFRFLGHGIWSRYVQDVSIINIHVNNARNRGIYFRDSHNILLDNCKITNMVWEDRAYHTAFISCHDVIIRNHYVNSAAENSDGVNISYDNYNFLIENMRGIANDDFIAINPGATGEPEQALWARNISIVNAICDPGTYRGLRLYPSRIGGIENVTAENCVFRTLQNEAVVADDTSWNSVYVSATFNNCEFQTAEGANESARMFSTGNLTFRNCKFQGAAPRLSGEVIMDSCVFTGGNSNGLCKFVRSGKYTVTNCTFEKDNEWHSIFAEGDSVQLHVENCDGYRVRTNFTNGILSVINTNMNIEAKMSANVMSFCQNNTGGTITIPSPCGFSRVSTLPSVAKIGSTCVYNGNAYIAKSANAWSEL